jgi:L-asparaginase
LLATGGTIATVTEGGTSAARLSAHELLAPSASGLAPELRVEVEEISRVPSWQLDSGAMHKIAMRARAAAGDPEVTGVVVTHGTSTMEYTAYLTDLFLAGDVPVVFTGAMRMADRADADGPRNLRHALAVASSPESRSVGAVVCFAGGVFAARDVCKMEREAVDAFGGGLIGTVDDRGVVIGSRPRRPRRFDGAIEPKVALVKAYPGAGRAQVDAMLDEGALGMVVEGFPGNGGVPPGMQVGLGAAVETGIPVVLSSRAPHGKISSPPTGGTGDPLRELGLISAGDLTAEKAWVLLMAALGETHDRDVVREIFQEVLQ